MSAQISAPVKTPHPTDYFDVRSLLTEDERMIQDVVARFVDERVKPIIVQAFDDHRFPIELVPEMADLGLLGCYFDDYGCAGLSNVAYGLICQELDKGDAGIRSFVSVQTSLVMYPIHHYGSEAQKQRWLPAMARGEAIGCFGLTEAGGGSDPGSNRTRAVRDGGDWVINGSKMWITNGSIADVAVVWADTDEGVRGFLVEKGTPGYTARDIERTYSLRAVVTSELYFDNVRVPDANVLPAARSLGAPLSCLTQARFGIAWGAIGMATACFEEVLQYTGMRVLFGRPLSHTQTIQRRLADMCRRITTAQLLALQLGRLKDRHLAHHSQISMAKWNNVRMALDVARDARDMLGAAGISLEFSAIRHMLNYETVITYEGTETVHQLVVGRELTGHNAF